MTGLKRSVVIFLIMFTISLAAVGIGVFNFYMEKQGVCLPFISVGFASIGGLDEKAANHKIREVYDEILKNDYFVVMLENKTSLPIKYSDIETCIDYEATIKSIKSKSFKESVIRIVEAFYYSKHFNIAPVVTFNKDKLKNKLEALIEVVKKEAIDADIYIDNGKIVKVEDKPGQILDLNNTVFKISNEIGKVLSDNSLIELKASNKFEILSVTPKVTNKDFVDVDSIISSYSTEIKVLENLEYAKFAASAINKVLLRPKDVKILRECGEFSFNKYLFKLAKNNSIKYDISNMQNEGFNQVAATLNAAIINAGLNPTIIKTHDYPVDYIGLGLDALIIPDVQDYQFVNTTEFPLIIFAQVISDKIYINIIGNQKDTNIKNNIRIDTKKKIEPLIVNVENNDLQQGEKRVIVQGRQGVEVGVYRETYIDNKKVYEYYLYGVTYKATETIIQIGPGTVTVNKNSK